MIYIDFEFNNMLSEKVNLVCATTYNDETDETMEWWLHNDKETQIDLADYLTLHQDKTIFGYATIAESRSLISLGLNPTKFKWEDGFFEFRNLTNHNDKLNWGNQLVDGKVRFTKKPPPKWERTDADAAGFRHTHSLAEATYKLIGEIRDTEHKNKMRDLIISAPEEFSEKERHDIQKYCTEDVVFLPRIRQAILNEYEELGLEIGDELFAEMLSRGKYAAITAKMESYGYPIDFEKTKNFSSSVGPILEDCQREINSLFSNIRPFKFKRIDKKFSWDQKATKKWLSENIDMRRWMKTDGLKRDIKKIRDEFKKTNPRQKITEEEILSTLELSDYLSLSLDAWQQVFDYKHDYPKDNFGAQMVRYLKLKQNMNGFTPSQGRRNFWDSVGPDQRVRPYFNPYGSQSSRSQPPATSFLFLKPAWMRALCVPPPGKAIASFDYKSEEFFISALVSKCQNMINAYLSGDVYLYFGKLAGAIPWEGTKEEFKELRNLFKSLILGISYLMSAKGLAAKLTLDTGRVYTEEEAQDLIDTFYDAYTELEDWQEEIVDQYRIDGYIELPDGWTMWSGNDNHRSVCNLPIQGLGACILRKAVELADDAGLKVILTLHDAIYIEYDDHDFEAVDTLHRCMREAFVFYFQDQKEWAEQIGLDGYSWSRAYPTPTKIINKKGKEEKVFTSITTPSGVEIDIGDLYIDDRAEVEYNQFSKYFEERAENFL